MKVPTDSHSKGVSSSRHVHTLVVGAGVIGSSVAMQLAQKGAGEVLVVDFDLEGTFSSSELNAGGVRATWNHEPNILASKASIEYFESVSKEVGYRSCGYLWLHSPQAFPVAKRAREKQLALGWPVEEWSFSDLRSKVPFIDKTDGIAGIYFAPRDGLINPNLLKQHYRKQAATHGASFEDRIWIRECEFYRNGAGNKFRVLAQKFPASLTEEQKKLFLTRNSESIPFEQVEYTADMIVNCAGAWASELAQVLKYKTPSQAVPRQICIFDSRDVDLSPYGMIVDPSGLYFHPEASHGLAGFADTKEPPGYRFDYDANRFFNDLVWPILYERSTKFESLKHVTGWTGLYEISPDHSGIVGPVLTGDYGKTGKIFEAHSFSGHGAMQSYAAGIGLAEKIIHGRYQTVDLEAFSGARFDRNQPIQEHLII